MVDGFSYIHCELYGLKLFKMNVLKSLKPFFSIHLLIATLSISLLFSCGNAPAGTASGGSSGVQDNGVVRFSLDGADWVSAPPGHPEMKFEEEAITDGNTMVRVEAFAADGSHLALTIYSAAGVKPGTYPISDPGMSGFYEKGFAEGDGFVTNGMPSNPGSITITELSTERVAGTFAFAIRSAGDLEDIRQITDGTFDLKFTEF